MTSVERDKIGARFDVDHRPFEVQRPTLDHRRQRRRAAHCAGGAEIVEGHDLFVQHADSGHGEPNRNALIGGRDLIDAVRLGARQDHGVDVIADIDVAGRGEAFTDHHLVGACGIREAPRHHSRSPDVRAAVADGGEHTAPAECLGETGRRCPRPRHQWDAGEDSELANAGHLCKGVVERARVKARAAAGGRDEQLGRVHYIEEAAVRGRGAPGPCRRGQNDTPQHRDEQRQADPDTPPTSEVHPQPVRNDPAHYETDPAHAAIVARSVLRRPDGDHPS